MNIKLSINIPLFNEAHGFEKTFNSLLKQIDHLEHQYEMNIADDCSTDSSYELCNQLIINNPSYNINLYRHKSNLGIFPNYMFLLGISKGEYVVFPSANDIYLNKFYNDGVKILDANPKVVLAHSHMRVIGINTKKTLWFENCESQGQGRTPYERFLNTLKNLETVSNQGVFRKSALNKTSGWRDIPGADHILLNEISLYGNFYNLGKIHIDYYTLENKFEDELIYKQFGLKSFFFKSRYIYDNIKSVFSASHVTFITKTVLTFHIIFKQYNLIIFDFYLYTKYLYNKFIKSNS